MRRLCFSENEGAPANVGPFSLPIVHSAVRTAQPLLAAGPCVAARRRSTSWPRLAAGHQRLAHTCGGSSCRGTAFSISAAKSSYCISISRVIRRASASRIVSARRRVSWALLRHWEGLSRVRCAGHSQPILVSSLVSSATRVSTLAMSTRGHIDSEIGAYIKGEGKG
jgi:hypothetical protein